MTRIGGGKVKTLSLDAAGRHGLVALAFLSHRRRPRLHGTFGVFFDGTHSYVVPFWISLGCLVVSIFIVLASSRVVQAQKDIAGN
jgi:hypothetical protein